MQRVKGNTLEEQRAAPAETIEPTEVGPNKTGCPTNPGQAGHRPRLWRLNLWKLNNTFAIINSIECLFYHGFCSDKRKASKHIDIDLLAFSSQDQQQGSALA